MVCGGVQVVRRGDEHGIDAGIGQQGIEVAVGGSGAVGLGECLRAGLVAAVDGNEVRVGRSLHRGGDFQVCVGAYARDCPA